MMLSNRIAIITGGARGIGRGTAIKFAEEGCSLVIADVLVAEAEQTLEEIFSRGREGIFVRCDVSDSRQVKDMVRQVFSKFGGVDILVNNAGIGTTPISITDLSEEEWDRVLAINLKGVFLCCKEVVPHMKAKRYGKIINISALAAIAPPAPNIHYSSAKAGVLGFTRDLALELAPFNICVNAIVPGAILTPMLEHVIPADTNKEIEKAVAPMQRLGTPEDVAGAALFLASSLSGYVTGDRILVSGGSPLRLKFAVKRTTAEKKENS